MSKFRAAAEENVMGVLRKQNKDESRNMYLDGSGPRKEVSRSNQEIMQEYYRELVRKNSTVKTKTPRRSKYPTESQEMQILAEYLDANGYLWCHVPNEGRRSPRNGARLKREGVKRGVPDVLIFAPVRIAVELKRVGGKGATDEQTAWLLELFKAGWHADVSQGASKAIEFIERCVRTEPP